MNEIISIFPTPPSVGQVWFQYLLLLLPFTHIFWGWEMGMAYYFRISHEQLVNRSLLLENATSMNTSLVVFLTVCLELYKQGSWCVQRCMCRCACERQRQRQREPLPFRSHVSWKFQWSWWRPLNGIPPGAILVLLLRLTFRDHVARTQAQSGQQK